MSLNINITSLTASHSAQTNALNDLFLCCAVLVLCYKVIFKNQYHFNSIYINQYSLFRYLYNFNGISMVLQFYKIIVCLYNPYGKIKSTKFRKVKRNKIVIKLAHKLCSIYRSILKLQICTFSKRIYTNEDNFPARKPCPLNHLLCRY